jgi:hypothetical protein
MAITLPDAKCLQEGGITRPVFVIISLLYYATMQLEFQ